MARKAPPPSHKKHAPHTKNAAPKRGRKSTRSTPRPLVQKGAFLGALAALGSLIGSQFM